MSCKRILASTFIAMIASAGIVASIAIAEPSKDAKPAGQPEMKLPAGWTAADMQACVEAGTPGKMQALLAKDAGTWVGKSTMWMTPDSPPMQSESTCTITPIMDGRYVKLEM